MNLFQLEYFVTLAEVLNYTNASDLLHITQPTLSKFIINLEHSIGSPLFIRNKRDVKLTPQGKLLYQEVKKTLAVYQQGIDKVRDLEKGTTGVLNVGILGTALLHFFPKVMNHFTEHYPTVRINTFDYSYQDISKNLSDGSIDLALLPNTQHENAHHFHQMVILSDPMCMVVHREHRYAGKKSIALSRLKDEPLIHMDPKHSPRDTEFINAMFQREALRPNVIYEATSLFNMLLMADCKIGYTILALHMKEYASNDLCFVPITGFEDYFKIICAYGDHKNNYVEQFLRVLQNFRSYP